MPDLAQTLEALKRPAPAGAFNQYTDNDPQLDRPDGAQRRLANLSLYLQMFSGARCVLVGEAAGYGGCRFSGIPFTDERQLVGPDTLPWAGREHGFERSSRDDRALSREASARVVWKVLADRPDVALWNVVPWHPAAARGPLSNKLPSRAMRSAGTAILRLVLETVWRSAQPLAVGRTAEQALRELGFREPVYLRHPSQGGSTLFRHGLAARLEANPG